MKRTLWIIVCCFATQLAMAQIPKWAEKAKKAVFSVVTYDKDNKIKGTGNGFYIDNLGTALSDYSLLKVQIVPLSLMLMVNNWMLLALTALIRCMILLNLIL